jgi:hypothetical protein
MSSEMKYVEAYKYESFGGRGYLGLRIMVAANRELNEIDGRVIRHAAESLHDGIMAETIRLDPDTTPRRAVERAEILKLFPQPIFVEEIPNGYCSSWCCRQKPWFIVTTAKGRIKIGWRKSVINIDWSDSAITQGADTLFPSENVTKGDKYIHAWGYDQAEKYMLVLLADKET